MSSPLTLSLILYSIFNSTFYLLSSFGQVGLFIQCLLLVSAIYLVRRVDFRQSLFLFSVSICFVLFSPPGFEVIKIVPMLGLFFSGRLRQSITLVPSRNLLVLLPILSILFAACTLQLFPSAASNNFLSILLLYTSLYLYSLRLLSVRVRLAVVLSSILLFLFFKNRTSIFFLLFAPVSTPIFLLILSSVLSLTLISYFGLPILESIPHSAFQRGGFLWFQPDTRFLYLVDFLTSPSPLDHTSNANLLFVPQTSKGYYDFHNSYLTNLFRDNSFFFFKLLIFVYFSFRLPRYLSIVILFRAFFDSFLFGSIYDLVLWSALLSSRSFTADD
jgi:hypothetical protein